MERVCFLLRVKPDRVAEYRERHAAVWPEMRDALRRTGWRNYSIFVSDDGQVVGYLETDDFAKAQAEMAKTGVNARWQAEMAEFFEGLDDKRPDEGIVGLAEAFHLD
jgi:L-rhamnose mutarotase